MPTYAVIDGECYIYTRPKSAVLWCRYKVQKKDAHLWRRETTKKKTVDEAKQAALMLYMDAKRLADKGAIIRENGRLVVTFKDVCDMRLAELKDQYKQNGSDPKGTISGYIRTIENFIIPFFINKLITEVDDDLIYDYEQAQYKRMGKMPSKSTLNKHNICLRSIFKLAKRKKYVTNDQMPELTVKDKGKQAGRRPDFSFVEMNKILKDMNIWKTKGDKSITRYKRKLLYYYVQFLYYTGVRPGKEPELIKWKHITEKWRNNFDKKDYVHISMPHRKTKGLGKSPRQTFILAPTDLVTMALEPLARLTKCNEPDDLIFCYPDGEPIKGLSQMFIWFLDEFGIRNNELDEGRSLYSIRHFYATERLRQTNAEWAVIADQMGTSVAMLERNYYHVLKERKADTFAAPALDMTKRLGNDDDDQKIINAVKTMDEETKARVLALLQNS